MSRIISNVIVAVEYKYHYYTHHAYVSKKVGVSLYDLLMLVLEYERLLYFHDDKSHDFFVQRAPL